MFPHFAHSRFTHETGWAITSVSGDVLASAPPGEYSSFGGGSIMNATVSVAVGKPHIFTLVDSLGDGSKSLFLLRFYYYHRP